MIWKTSMTSWPANVNDRFYDQEHLHDQLITAFYDLGTLPWPADKRFLWSETLPWPADDHFLSSGTLPWPADDRFVCSGTFPWPADDCFFAQEHLHGQLMTTLFSQEHLLGQLMTVFIIQEHFRDQLMTGLSNTGIKGMMVSHFFLDIEKEILLMYLCFLEAWTRKD